MKKVYVVEFFGRGPHTVVFATTDVNDVRVIVQSGANCTVTVDGAVYDACDEMMATEDGYELFGF